MIIECPACTPRYDIKATLPPEGRTVRCAKCETVWRAMPDAVGEVNGGGDDREDPSEEPSANGAVDNSNSERQRGMGQAARGQTYEQEWTQSAAGEFPREERAAFQDAAPSEDLPDEHEGDDPSFHAGGVERIGRPDDSEITRNQYPEADQDPEPEHLGQDQD